MSSKVKQIKPNISGMAESLSKIFLEPPKPKNFTSYQIKYIISICDKTENQLLKLFSLYDDYKVFGGQEKQFKFFNRDKIIEQAICTVIKAKTNSTAETDRLNKYYYDRKSLEHYTSFFLFMRELKKEYKKTLDSPDFILGGTIKYCSHSKCKIPIAQIDMLSHSINKAQCKFYSFSFEKCKKEGMNEIINDLIKLETMLQDFLEEYIKDDQYNDMFGIFIEKIKNMSKGKAKQPPTNITQNESIKNVLRNFNNLIKDDIPVFYKVYVYDRDSVLFLSKFIKHLIAKTDTDNNLLMKDVKTDGIESSLKTTLSEICDVLSDNIKSSDRKDMKVYDKLFINFIENSENTVDVIKSIME